jgi:hypothetical protein
MSKEIPFIYIINGELIIRLAATDLKLVAEHKPDASYQIINANGFLKDFAEALKNYAQSNATELGITELQYLFDQVIDETYINGSKYIIDETVCPYCNGEGSVEGKTGGSEGIPEADVLFVCQYCNGTGKIKQQ